MTGFLASAVGVFVEGKPESSAAVITVGVSVGDSVEVLGVLSERAVVEREVFTGEAAEGIFERRGAGSFERIVTCTSLLGVLDSCVGDKGEEDRMTEDVRGSFLYEPA
jgi:hypothetical protein